MPTPTLTLWTFDGPPPEYTSDADLPTPPPSEKPKDLATTPTTKDSTGKDDDDLYDEFYEEFYDAPATQEDPTQAKDDKGKGKALPPPPSTPPATPPKSAAQKILYGEHHNATFDGTSQYSRGGSSACGLASLNAIRLAFDFYDRIKDGEELVTKLVSEEFVKDAMAITASWADQMHLEVEPTLELPMFSTAFQILDARYGEARYRTFSDLLLSLKPEKGSTGPRAACLTRTPEIIAILHIPIAQPNYEAPTSTSRRRVDSIYLIFDSHPRPNHPDGAGIQVFPSNPTDDVAEYLMDLFQFDDALVNDPHLQWHVQLLGQVSYHVLAPAEDRKTLNEYDLNMRFLALQQKVTEAKQKLDEQLAEKRETQRQYFALEQEIAMLKHRSQKKDDEIKELKTLTEPASSWRSVDNKWGWTDNFAIRSFKGKGREHVYDHSSPSTSSPGSKPSRSGTTQFEFSSPHKTTDRSKTLPAIPPRPSDAQPRATPTLPNRTPVAGPSSSKHTSARSQDLDTVRSLELAMAMQREFDEERQTFALDASLARATERPKFDCGICMDSFTDESIAIVEGCEHSCCRDCMRDNIQSKIDERRYPIPCPFCVADSDKPSRPGNKGTIQAWLVETIGISPKSFEIFTEMQMAEHSIMIDCRKCSQSAFVDRKDYELIEIITCPLPKCTHSWCKQCNQSIEGGKKHSCDGSAELESLMNQRGWKHCPGCRTPIERSMGCNHMTCTTPGCNMHFCYLCGAVVTSGGTRNEIQRAVASHYRTCALFDVPGES